MLTLEKRERLTRDGRNITQLVYRYQTGIFKKQLETVQYENTRKITSYRSHQILTKL